MAVQPRKLSVLHFLNQFFGGVGGEEQAGLPPELREGPLGRGACSTGSSPAVGSRPL